MRCRISTDAAAVANPVTPIPPAAPAPVAGNPAFPLQKSSYLLNDGWPDGEVEDYQVDIESAGPRLRLGRCAGRRPWHGTRQLQHDDLRQRPQSHYCPGRCVSRYGGAGSRIWKSAKPRSDCRRPRLISTTRMQSKRCRPSPPSRRRFSLTLTATNRTGVGGTLRCWIDFNRNGSVRRRGRGECADDGERQLRHGRHTRCPSQASSLRWRAPAPSVVASPMRRARWPTQLARPYPARSRTFW